MNRPPEIQREQGSFLTPSWPPRLASTRVLIVVAACFIALIFAIYSPSLGFQFILDDHRFTADPRIQDSGHIWDYFTNYVWAQFTGGPPSFYRPVFVLWMRINFLLAALSSWGWHLLSIAKHVAVAILLAWLIWKLIDDALAAIAVAILFALHPAQTESVSWVTVPDPLMSAALLAALLFYLRHVHSASATGEIRKNSRKFAARKPNQPSPLWLLASAASFLAALLAKETAIVFPAVIFALAFYEQQPAKDTAKTPDANLRIRTTHASRQVFPFVFVTALYLLLRLNALGRLGTTTQHLPLRTVVLSWPLTLCFYIKAILWPVKSYSFADPTLVEGFSAHEVLLPFLALAGIVSVLAWVIVWAWRRSEREPNSALSHGVKSALIIGALLLTLPLLLTLNLNGLNPGDFLHGRYTYLPLAGLALLESTVLRLAGRFRLALFCLTGVLVLVFVPLTLSQEKQWSDDTTVFTIAHQLAPHNDPVAQNLANTRVQAALLLADEGRCSEAMPVFQEVAQRYPQDWYAWAGLGDCYFQNNDLVKAEESLHRAADISHNDRVIQQWQELRAHMGLPSSVPAN